jgi:hypothetical protein
MSLAVYSDDIIVRYSNIIPRSVFRESQFKHFSTY